MANTTMRTAGAAPTAHVPPSQAPSSGFNFKSVLQELIQRGVIAPSLVVSAAHSDADVDRTIEAAAGALAVLARALEDGVGPHLRGRAVKPVWRTYN